MVNETDSNIPTIAELNNILGIAPEAAPVVPATEPKVDAVKPEAPITPKPAEIETPKTPELPKAEDVTPVPDKPKAPVAEPVTTQQEDDSKYFSPEEQKLLTSQMSTKAREWVRARAKELREARSVKDTLAKELNELKSKPSEPQTKPHYEHPQGYVLDEDYQNLVLSANKAKTNSEIVASQLALIEDGEDFQMPLIDADGNIVLSQQKSKPTGADKAKLLRAMAALDRQSEHYEQQASVFIGAYESRIKTQHGRVEALERQVIPDWDKIVTADKETATAYDANLGAIRKAGFNPGRDPWIRAAVRAITIAQRQQVVINNMQSAIQAASREQSIAKTVGPVGVGAEASKPARGNTPTIADIQQAWGD